MSAISIKDLVDGATLRALRYNSDAATERFYAALMERRLQSTRCCACGHLPYPPRPFCPACGGDEVEWVDLPPRGTLYAFSQQARALRFLAPDVLGLVELPGCAGLVFTRIDAALGELSIGQPVEVDFVEVSPELVLHQFRPVD